MKKSKFKVGDILEGSVNELSKWRVVDISGPRRVHTLDWQRTESSPWIRLVGPFFEHTLNGLHVVKDGLEKILEKL